MPMHATFNSSGDINWKENLRAINRIFRTFPKIIWQNKGSFPKCLNPLSGEIREDLKFDKWHFDWPGNFITREENQGTFAIIEP